MDVPRVFIRDFGHLTLLVALKLKFARRRRDPSGTVTLIHQDIPFQIVLMDKLVAIFRTDAALLLHRATHAAQVSMVGKGRDWQTLPRTKGRTNFLCGLGISNAGVEDLRDGVNVDVANAADFVLAVVRRLAVGLDRVVQLLEAAVVLQVLPRPVTHEVGARQVHLVQITALKERIFTVHTVYY